MQGNESAGEGDLFQPGDTLSTPSLMLRYKRLGGDLHMCDIAGLFSCIFALRDGQ